MTDKERDDALMAKANENWQAAGVPLPYPDWLAREVLRLERSGWQPKPDRWTLAWRDGNAAALDTSTGNDMTMDAEMCRQGQFDQLKSAQAFIEVLRKHFPEAERPAVAVPSEEQIKQMVTRFLGWKLPDDFHPDDGISFEPEFNKEWNASQGKPPQRHTPTGTNLFNYTQAEAMVRYMLGDDT